MQANLPPPPVTSNDKIRKEIKIILKCTNKRIIRHLII